MDDFESLRSKRVMISFIACCTAFLTSGWELSETRMAALLYIGRRAAKAADDECAHAILGPFHVVLRIHGADDGIVRNLTVKRGHEPPESFFADDGISLFFSHCDNGFFGFLVFAQLFFCFFFFF